MNTKEFHITVYSINRFIVVFIMMVIILFSLLDYIQWSQNIALSVIVDALVVLPLSFYLAKLAGSAKVKIVFTEEAFFHIWKKMFIFSSEKNIKIPWNIVDNYVFEPERFFDSFIINLTTHRKYKITRLSLFSVSDDFDEFCLQFPVLANRYRNQNTLEEKTQKIEQGESFYASKEFRWIFYVMVAMFVPVVILLIISPNSKVNWGVLMVIASALAFYGIMIKANGKK